MCTIQQPGDTAATMETAGAENKFTSVEAAVAAAKRGEVVEYLDLSHRLDVAELVAAVPFLTQLKTLDLSGECMC